jgi:hypothetical protein
MNRYTGTAPAVTIGISRDTVFNDSAVIEHKLSSYRCVSVSLSTKSNILGFGFAPYWDCTTKDKGYTKLIRSATVANKFYCKGLTRLWEEILYPYLYPSIDREDWGSTRMKLECLGLIDGDYRLYCKLDRY